MSPNRLEKMKNQNRKRKLIVARVRILRALDKVTRFWNAQADNSSSTTTREY